MLGLFAEGLACLFDSKEIPKPPLAVRMASWIELFSGILALVCALGWIGDAQVSTILFWSAVCILWIASAVALYFRKRWARVVCLYIALLRLVTIIGIPVSFTTIYLLYFRTDSKEFFHGSRTENTGID
jgi:hypothetical protein